MNRTVTSILSLLFVGLAAAARGEAAPTDYEHLKPLEWMIGDWVAEYTAPFAFAEVKEGDRVVSHVSRRWILGKNAFVMDGQLEVNGKRMPLTHEVNYWDPTSETVSMWAQSAFGTGRGVFTTVGDRAVLEFSTHREGSLAGTAVLEKIDDNSYAWHITGVTVGGERKPDWPAVTFRRKTGTPAGDLWEAYVKSAAGKWSGIATVLEDYEEAGLARGDQLRGTHSLEPALDGKAMVGEMSFQAVDKAASGKSRFLVAWDPAARHVRCVSIWNNGTMEELVLTSRQGTAFLGTYTAKDIGGAGRHGRVRVDYPDADSVVITFLDGPFKGKGLSSWKRVK